MNYVSKLFLALCILTAGSVVANAQLDTDVNIRARVPFAFSVDNKVLPAGEYEISALEGVPGILEIRNSRGRAVMTVNTDNVMAKGDRPEKMSELVFEKIGDEYFLVEVWSAGSLNGSEVPRSKAEKELIGGGSKPERHSVAAVLRHMKP